MPGVSDSSGDVVRLMAGSAEAVRRACERFAADGWELVGEPETTDGDVWRVTFREVLVPMDQL